MTGWRQVPGPKRFQKWDTGWQLKITVISACPILDVACEEVPESYRNVKKDDIEPQEFDGQIKS